MKLLSNFKTTRKDSCGSGGATTPGIAFGRILQVGGVGTKSYGNYKLGKKDQIWKDAVTTIATKSALPIFKKLTK